jgi:glucose-1-phosphate adenylyltransferase
MDLLAEPPELDLYSRDSFIITKPSNQPPAKIGPNAQVRRSFLNSGCVINGFVDHSVLSPGVIVEEGAVVRDAILFDDCRIEAGAIVRHAVLDKGVVIGRDSYVGFGDDLTPNQQRPDLLHSGITIVGKRARLPGALRVGRNCIIGPSVVPEGPANGYLPSGSTLMSPNQGPRFRPLSV